SPSRSRRRGPGPRSSAGQPQCSAWTSRPVCALGRVGAAPSDKEGTVHAVVVNVTISDFEGGRKMLEEEVVPRVKQAPGFVAGYWTRGEGDSGLSMLVFE